MSLSGSHYYCFTSLKCCSSVTEKDLSGCHSRWGRMMGCDFEGKGSFLPLPPSWMVCRPWRQLYSPGSGALVGGKARRKAGSPTGFFTLFRTWNRARGACVGADNTPGSGYKGLVTGGHPLAEEEPLQPAMPSSWSREGHGPLRGWKVAVVPDLWLCLPGCFVSRWGGGGVGVSWGIWK